MQRRQHSWRDVTDAVALLRKPPTIIKQPGITAHAQIEDWLADAIAAGQLSPGDRLPTEQDLAAWLGVSLVTLRHALSELAQHRRDGGRDMPGAERCHDQAINVFGHRFDQRLVVAEGDGRQADSRASARYKAEAW